MGKIALLTGSGASKPLRYPTTIDIMKNIEKKFSPRSKTFIRLFTLKDELENSIVNQTQGNDGNNVTASHTNRLDIEYVWKLNEEFQKFLKLSKEANW